MAMHVGEERGPAGLGLCVSAGLGLCLLGLPKWLLCWAGRWGLVLLGRSLGLNWASPWVWIKRALGPMDDSNLM